MSDVTVPVPFPGHTFGHLIKNFTMADVHFGLPDPFAEPDTPEAKPRISAIIKALVALPEEMNFNVSVGRVRANADVFYHGDKLGYLDLHKWQDANSTRIDSVKDDGPLLAVQSAIEDAPLTVTDEDVFTDVLNALLFHFCRDSHQRRLLAILGCRCETLICPLVQKPCTQDQFLSIMHSVFLSTSSDMIQLRHACFSTQHIRGPSMSRRTGKFCLMSTRDENTGQLSHAWIVANSSFR